MRRNVVGSTIGILSLCLVVRSARADTTLHVIGSASVGYNDNLLGTPSDPAPGEPTPIRTWFLEVAPGFTVFHESPRALHQLTYTHPMAVYFSDNDLDAASDIVSWRGMFTLSPRDELTLGASVARSRINAGVLRNQVGQDATMVTPAGAGVAVTIGANQGYTHDFDQQWHGLQTASFTTATHVGSSSSEPNHYLIDASVGTEYTVGDDGFALVLTGGWFFTPPQREGGVQITPRQDLLNLGSEARWRHDWSPRWSTRTTAGVVASVDPHDVWDPLWSPTWSTGLFYFAEGPTASLVYARTVAPNVLTGQNYLTDQVTLNGGVPLSQNVPLLLGSSIAGARSRGIDVPTHTLTNTVRSVSGDVSLSWLSDAGIGASIRYQHYRQYGDESDIAPLATFHRNVVQLTIGGMFPPRELPTVPGGPPVRVDGGDRAIVGGTSTSRPRQAEPADR